jgi:hypothetical protein
MEMRYELKIICIPVAPPNMIMVVPSAAEKKFCQ